MTKEMRPSKRRGVAMAERPILAAPACNLTISVLRASSGLWGESEEVGLTYRAWVRCASRVDAQV